MKKPANPDVEYVLVYDFPPWAGDGESDDKVLVPKDTVVINVRYKSTSSLASAVILGGDSELEFTVKDTGEKYTTNYGYMFALNTPENLAHLGMARSARAIREQAERAAKHAMEQVETVAGPFEGTFKR